MLLSCKQQELLEAGIDEAGRGCLAGPVYAAAVIFPFHYRNERLNDSKKLTHEKRMALKKEIERDAIAWAIAAVCPEKIDDINILNASILAMHRALDKLSVRPGYLLIDGNRFKPYRNLPYECIIKGDGKYLSIAAASILAKTWRDEYLCKIHLDYPCYAWKDNKGYPTSAHRRAILEHGISPHHRRSFRLYPTPRQLSLFNSI